MPDKKAARDKWIKLGFLGAILVALLVVYLLQSRDIEVKGWGTDLPAALAKAKTEDRDVLILFVNAPPSATARKIQQKIIPKPANTKAVTNGNFVPVTVSLDGGLEADLAKQYKLKALPTLMILGSDGTERRRHEGNIGEVPFRQAFLEGGQGQQ